MNEYCHCAYERALTCARFELDAAQQWTTDAPDTAEERHVLARVRQARLTNATEMARMLVDFDIAMRAGQPLPAAWLRPSEAGSRDA